MEKKTARPFQKDISPDKTKNVETGKIDVPGKRRKSDQSAAFMVV